MNVTLNVIEEVLNQSKKEHITDPKQINEILVDKMFVGYAEKGDIQNDVVFRKDGPTVLLVVGVNGVGKTTTIAKLAHRYLNQGKKVLLVAADTFRAGAVEQLTTWAERLKINIVTGKPESDPASVAYDGVKKAKEDNISLLMTRLILPSSSMRLFLVCNLPAVSTMTKSILSSLAFLTPS